MSYLTDAEDGTTMHGFPSGGQLGQFGWTVKFLGAPEGHEAITRAAMGTGTISFSVAGRPASRVLTPAERDQIIAGNRSVDLGWHGTGAAFAFNPGEQKRHALRRVYGQPQATAVTDIVGSLRGQHASILREPDWMKKLHLIGQATHLVQDSFSPAHTRRIPGSGWCIRYVRNYGRGSYPAEHKVPKDPRDEVARSRAEASKATDATRRYLQIVFKAIYGLTRPDPVASREAAAELNSFMATHFRGCVVPGPSAPAGSRFIPSSREAVETGRRIARSGLRFTEDFLPEAARAAGSAGRWLRERAGGILG